jgi:hypothetical protein
MDLKTRMRGVIAELEKEEEGYRKEGIDRMIRTVKYCLDQYPSSALLRDALKQRCLITLQASQKCLDRTLILETRKSGFVFYTESCKGAEYAYEKIIGGLHA